MKTRKHVRAFLTCSCLSTLLAVAAPAVAEQEDKPAKSDRAAKQDMGDGRFGADVQHRMASSSQILEGDKLLNMAVRDSQGDQIGQIKDVVIDFDNGRIAYAVASLNEWGLGDKYFAVPWQAFKTGQDGQSLTLSADKSKFDQAQSFDMNHFPDPKDRKGLERTYQRFGYQPYWQQNQQGQKARADQGQGDFWVHRLSKLQGLQVTNGQGVELGTVDGLVVDAREGRVTYGLVGLKDTTTRTAVPWTAFKVDHEQDRLIVDSTQQAMQSGAYQKGQEPDFNNQQWAQDTHQRYNAEPFWLVYGYSVYDIDTNQGSMQQLFQQGQKETVQGKVQSVQDGRITLQTQDGKTCQLILDPRQMSQQNLSLKQGDQIQVTGQKVTLVQPTQIKKGDKTFSFGEEHSGQSGAQQKAGNQAQ